MQVTRTLRRVSGGRKITLANSMDIKGIVTGKIRREGTWITEELKIEHKGMTIIRDRKISKSHPNPIWKVTSRTWGK